MFSVHKMNLKDLDELHSIKIVLIIWQFLKQDITPKQAKEAYAQATGKNYKLKREYLKRQPKTELTYKQLCKKKKYLLSIEDKECFNFALRF